MMPPLSSLDGFQGMSSNDPYYLFGGNEMDYQFDSQQKD
jgi:hypothetical protein